MEGEKEWEETRGHERGGHGKRRGKRRGRCEGKGMEGEVRGGNGKREKGRGKGRKEKKDVSGGWRKKRRGQRGKEKRGGTKDLALASMARDDLPASSMASSTAAVLLAAWWPQCAVKWDRNLKPKLAIMRQCTSVTDRWTDRRTLTSYSMSAICIFFSVYIPKLRRISYQRCIYITSRAKNEGSD